MQVHDIMHSDVQLADPNMTIRDAARRMRAGDIGALPVGENDRLIGMVDRPRYCRTRNCRGSVARKYDRPGSDVGGRLLLFRG
jgi:predicted transcriptional regulator